MLAKLCGWVLAVGDTAFHVWWDGERAVYIGDRGDVAYEPLNLYEPKNMALAWRVLNWADESSSFGLEFEDFWKEFHLWAEPPGVAQREWLDKILTLAIEAGFVELQKEVK